MNVCHGEWESEEDCKPVLKGVFCLILQCGYFACCFLTLGSVVNALCRSINTAENGTVAHRAPAPSPFSVISNVWTPGLHNRDWQDKPLPKVLKEQVVSFFFFFNSPIISTCLWSNWIYIQFFLYINFSKLFPGFLSLKVREWKTKLVLNYQDK